MSEPLHESAEESWITYLNRFDSEIYPLFAKRGYTKGEALIAWSLNDLMDRIDDLPRRIRESEDADDWDAQ